MKRRNAHPGFVIPWRLLALIVGPVVLLGFLSAGLIMWFDHRDATSYDSGGADPADFSKEEEAVRLRVGGDDVLVKFGPHYRFTKLDRDRKRMDLGFRMRMATMRNSAARITGQDPGDVYDPPAVALRVRRAHPRTFRGIVVDDTIYFLDGDGRFILSESNHHGDDWVRWVIPHWQ